MTKAIRTALAAATIMAATLTAQKAEAPESLMQAAIKKEVVDGNLPAAIEGYRKALTAAKGNRALAATALIHMAACYHKMGDAESRKIYERVLREYADQTEAAAMARSRLGVQAASNAGGNIRQVWAKVGGSPYGPVSPDRRYVAFTSHARSPVRSGVGNLAVHDLISGADLVLTKNENPAEGPGNRVFSPDSRQIAYVWTAQRPGEHRFELRVTDVNPNGPAKPRVLFHADFPFGTSDWSPDGKWIAVGLSRPDHTIQLGLVSTADGTLRVLKSLDWEGSTHVYFSPDSQYLAFDRLSESSGRRDIFVLAADGSREVPAVIHPSEDRLAGWTPDGKHLLFISDRNGRPALWWLPFEGGKPQGNPEMLRADFGGNQLGRLWPGRSTDLYYLVRGGGVRVSIASVDLESGKSSQANMEQFTNGINPAWSADGKFLVYETYQDGDGGTFLTVRSVETGLSRELRPNLKYVSWPSWSPDGRSLVVQGFDMKGRQGIFRIDAQTAQAEPIAIATELGVPFLTPQWLPDGKGILYERSVRKPDGTRDGEVIEHDLSSGKESVIARLKSLQSLQNTSRCFAVSPDGRSLAYLTATSLTTHSIMLMPLAGGEARELLKLGRAFLGGWTPDSRSLLYSHSADQAIPGGTLPADVTGWLLPVNGDQPRRLELPESFVTQLQVHPDGKRVAFWSNNQTAEQVWVLENFLPAAKARK